MNRLGFHPVGSNKGSQYIFSIRETIEKLSFELTSILRLILSSATNGESVDCNVMNI